MHEFTEMARACAVHFDENEIELAVERKAHMNESTATLLHLAPIFSLIAAGLCLVLLVFIGFAVVRRRIPSRKYIVVVSRTVSDIFSCVLIAASSFFATRASASHAVLALFLFVATFAFLQLSLSHIWVIILRQISVTRPYGFQSICSVRRVCSVVAVGWIISILYCAAYTPLTTVILDERKDNVCSFSGCQEPLLVVCIALITILIGVVLVLYAVVVVKLLRTATSERMHNEPEVTKKKLKKFLGYGGHIALFVFISVLTVIGAGLILRNAKQYTHIRAKMKEDCDVVEYIDAVIRLELIAGGVVLLWCVRVIFDVLIVVLCEYRRLLPWLNSNNLEPLRDNQVASRTQSLKWQKAGLNCPVFAIDAHFHPWDFKN